MIIDLCDRFKKLPSEVMREDVELLRMIKIVDMGRGDRPGEEVDGYGE